MYEQQVASLVDLVGPHLRSDFFFPNVGASDGIVADPIYPFLRGGAAGGIAVEPVP